MRKLSYPLLLVIVGTASLSSCEVLNPKSKNKPGDNVVPQTSTEESGVMFVDFEDAACQEQSVSKSFDRATIWQWSGTEATPLEVDMKGTGGDSEGAVTSDGVLGAVTKLVWEYKCNLYEDDCKLDKKPAETKVVKICQTKPSYRRDSIESVTLTSQYFSTSAYDFYHSLRSKRDGLDDTILVIHPKFKRHYSSDGSVEIDSDNASFVKTDKAKIFLVYPTSMKSFSKSPVHLWEVPFTMKHEYGHHVFAHHVKSGPNGSSTADIIGEIHTHNENVLPFSGRKRHEMALTSAADTAKLIFKGVNEMFADLFSFYANAAKGGQLKGVYALEVTRDPLSPTTVGGQPKVLTADILKIIEGKSEPLKVTDKRDPSYDDEHDVAAVLGYPVARLIEKSHPDKSNEQKADLLIRWLDKLSAYVETNRTSITLDGMIELLVTVIAEDSTLSATQKEQTCAEFRKLVPGLVKSSAACR